MPCRFEVAVSVLTPPKLAGFAKGAARAVKRCESKELAGRARRRAERANTIVKSVRAGEMKNTQGAAEGVY